MTRYCILICAVRVFCLVQTMAAQDNANMLELISIILLVAEGAVLIPLAIAYVTLLRRNVAVDRVKLYSIFLRVPRPTVVAQAKAEVRLVGDGGDEEEDEQPVSCGFAYNE